MSSVQKSKRGSPGVNAETDSFDDTDDLKESPIPNMESSTVMEEIDAKHRLSESSEDPEEVSGEEDQHISKALKSDFRPYGCDFAGGKPIGRFSNGKVPGDFISKAFGCKPIVPAYLDISHNISEFATGVNFASAGTGLVAPIAGLLINQSLRQSGTSTISKKSHT